MPVNLTVPETLFPVAGVSLAGISAGIKASGAKDLVLIGLAPETVCAGVFTRNAYCAAPVTVCRDHLAASKGQVRALLVNSGGANAATGSEGERNARECCQRVATKLGIEPRQVMPFSTGVIGEQLPMERMLSGIDTASAALAHDNWRDAADGILTTDTLPKLVSRQIMLSSGVITLTGMAKGSGMIQPNMATMLAYLFTDATVTYSDLQQCLNQATAGSFNAVSVDGDTSTNDSYLLCATGQSDADRIQPGSADWTIFCDAVNSMSLELAHAIIRDGEGATKFIGVHVAGGRSADECRQIGFTVANSPLVKTACFASDANLGRIIMAVGRSGVDGLDINALSLTIGDVAVLAKGQPVSTYTDEQGQAVMSEAEIDMYIDVGLGDHNASVWTSDFSHEYVRINAEYRS